MEWSGDWIWTAQPCQTQNCVCCFSDVFSMSATKQFATLYITADTRYVVYCNGTEVGRGPIRSVQEHWYYDSYDIAPWLQPGENHLAVRVWSYGVSNYQALAHAPGVRYEIRQEQVVLCKSGAHTHAALDEGIRSFTVKRNANMGFMEHYDAQKFDSSWPLHAQMSAGWSDSTLVPDTWGPLYPRPVKPFHSQTVYPKRIVSLQETEPGCQQVSIDLRTALFPGRQDINASIFSGFLAAVIEAPRAMEGTITFPCRTWNGILGDFKLDNVQYAVSNEHRSIPVSFKQGRQLFLMQISGKFDDLFCHMEFAFPSKISFAMPYAEAKSPFWAIGPTQVLHEQVDGISTVYGGLDEFNRFPSHTPHHNEIFACDTLETLKDYQDEWKTVADNAVFYDEYIYSLVHTQHCVRDYNLTDDLNGVLWNNGLYTELCTPQTGNAICLTLDFEDIYVGALEFTLQAAAGTVLDIYGFENRYGGEIDYTVGLNNSTRYICKDGCQTYRCIARTGARYLLLRVTGTTAPVRLYSVCIQHSTYAASGAGTFRCSDAALQQIWQCAKHTHTLCMEDTFTDCPTYEQAFWIGDAQVSANVNAVLYGEYALMRHCLVLTTQMKRNTPLYNALGPTDWNTNIPMWTMNWLLAIKQYVEYTADTAVLTELYPHIREVLDTYATFIRADNLLLMNAWNMLDWAPMDLANHCVVTGQQAILAYCYAHYAKVAGSLGYVQDETRYLQYHARLLEGIDTKLWSEEKQMFLDGWCPETGNSRTFGIQTHALLVLFDGVSDVRKRKLAKQYIAQPPQGFLQVGSPFMLFYLYEIFAAESNFQHIIDDVKTRWGGMMRYDCTTCWEVFPGFYEVGRTRSYCHSWSSAPVYFANTYLLGVRRQSNGYAKIRLEVPETSLTWCEGSIPTPMGVIEVRWEKTEEQNLFYLRAPATIEVDASALRNWTVKCEQTIALASGNGA